MRTSIAGPGGVVAAWAVAVQLALASICLTPGDSYAQQDVLTIRKRLGREVRHELLLLPHYSVFDDIKYEIEGLDTVVLSGQVVRPSLKNEAESVIRSLDGVRKVVDKIEILPFSATDGKIRTAVYHAIYSMSGLNKYAFQAFQPIHILVKDGGVILVGAVADEGDRDMAGAAAKEVPGVLDLTNRLSIQTH